MAFKLDNFGSDSSNAKSTLGGVCYYRYFNKNNDTLTTAGYFPADLGLEVGDRISVIPSSVTEPDEWYIVTNIANRTVTVKKIDVINPSRKFLEQFDEMPEATEENLGRFVQFIGETGTYTQGYIYANKEVITYDSTVEFNPATLSGTTAACSGSDFAAFVEEWGGDDFATMTKGTITYAEDGDLLVFVGKDDTDTTVSTFQLYTQDYEDAGFTFTGTLQDGDVITFTCDIEEITNYAWTQVNVQPTE